MSDTDRVLTGPWEAVLSGDGGFVLNNLDDITDEAHPEIAVVRGSALPVDQGDGSRRMPGTYFSDDVLYDRDDFDSDDDVRFHLALAKRVADALNRLDAADGAR